jgi:hypothetical protein
MMKFSEHLMIVPCQLTLFPGDPSFLAPLPAHAAAHRINANSLARLTNIWVRSRRSRSAIAAVGLTFSVAGIAFQWFRPADGIPPRLHPFLSMLTAV